MWVLKTQSVETSTLPPHHTKSLFYLCYKFYYICISFSEEMAPNVTSTPSRIEYEDESALDPLIPAIEKFDGYPKELPGKEYKLKLVWRNIILFVYLHVSSVYGAYLMLTSASWPTVLFGKNFNMKTDPLKLQDLSLMSL